jgi:hypothetical protein
MKKILGIILGFFACGGLAGTVSERVLWLEAEGFETLGGWSNDSQFVDVMGSPCLLATGVGKPVADAVTSVTVLEAGEYRLWVRCRDWLPTHSPGQFQVWVGGVASAATFGKSATNAWRWVDGGAFALATGKAEVRLRDVTGWWGRCDAVVLAGGGFRPSEDGAEAARQRQRYGGVSAEVKRAGTFDLVVVGGGPAGLGAALAAARHGCRVALVQDRPVLGGNASSEIEIPPMGYIGRPPDTVNVSGLAEELFPLQGWSNFADSKKLESLVRAETNLMLYLNTRATGVEMADAAHIRAVLALDVRSGQRLSFAAPLFIDCTGHGWIGYYAGAEWRMGAEPREAFGESLAPLKASAVTMGNSLYKAVIETRDGPVTFACPAWAHRWECDTDFEPRGSHVRTDDIVRPENFDRPSRGKGRNPGDDVNGSISHGWWVEYGGMRDTIQDAEEIRDELFRICVGLWNYAKNRNPATVAKNANRSLVWLNYVQGVRESRRLIGDYVMSQRDYDDQTAHPDVVAFTDWGVDVHHPEGFWVKGNDAIHVYKGLRVGIPYRTLYSKNIANLFMAGRCHSATQTAFGGTRVMRPMCATGQAAGTAAALAHRYGTTPRGVYESHLVDLQQALLRDGCYLPGVPNCDADDLAWTARAEASSEAENAGAANVNNGWSRKTVAGSNTWTPSPRAKEPPWVCLRLAKAVPVGEVHITFEKKSVSCAVQVLSEGGWNTVASLVESSPRRCVVSVPPVLTEAVRVLFEKKNQLAPAVCEIRVYGAKGAR